MNSEKNNTNKQNFIVLLSTAIFVIGTSLLFVSNSNPKWQILFASLWTFGVEKAKSEYGLALIFLLGMLMLYMTLGAVQVGMFQSHLWNWFSLIFFISTELLKVFGLVLGIFFLFITREFLSNVDITKEFFYLITMKTFFWSLIIYIILIHLSKIILKNLKGYRVAMHAKSELIKKNNMNGIINSLIIIITVALLADTIGNTFFTTLVSEDKISDIDDFINSKTFELIVPSLTVYITAIVMLFTTGDKK